MTFLIIIIKVVIWLLICVGIIIPIIPLFAASVLIDTCEGAFIKIGEIVETLPYSIIPDKRIRIDDNKLFSSAYKSYWYMLGILLACSTPIQWYYFGFTWMIIITLTIAILLGINDPVTKRTIAEKFITIDPVPIRDKSSKFFIDDNAHEKFLRYRPKIRNGSIIAAIKLVWLTLTKRMIEKDD